METIVTKLREAGISPKDIQELIDPCFGEVTDLLISKGLGFETLDIIMRSKQHSDLTWDQEWEDKYDSYWEMILDTINVLYNTEI